MRWPAVMTVDFVFGCGVVCVVAVGVASVGILRHADRPPGWHLRNSWALWFNEGFKPEARPWHRALLVAGAGFVLSLIAWMAVKGE